MKSDKDALKCAINTRGVFTQLLKGSDIVVDCEVTEIDEKKLERMGELLIMANAEISKKNLKPEKWP